MGCDIEAHLEVNVRGRWRYFAPAEIDRHYGLFAKMAGVRRSRPLPIAPPKGLPDDAAYTTRLHARLLDSPFRHSHSWLGLDELMEVLRYVDAELEGRPWREGMIGGERSSEFGVWLLGWPLSTLRDEPGRLPPEIKDARLVFWFND